MREIRSLFLILDLKFADLMGALRGMTPARIFGMLVSILIAVGIAAVIYRFDLFVFDYLMGMPTLGRLVIARFFELAFLLFFLALMISTALTALSMLYKEEELNLLLSLPIKHGTIFIVKYFEVIIFSSWALIALTLPFVLSYAVYFRMNWLMFFTILGGLLLPLVIISGSVGVAAALLIRWVLGGISRRSLLSWGTILLAVGLILVIFFKLMQGRTVDQGIGYLFTMIENQGLQDPTLLPHRLMSQGLVAILEARWDLLQRIVLTMMGSSVLIMLLTMDFGRVFYYRTWLASSDRAPTLGRSSALYKSSFWRLEKVVSPIYRALFRKDLLEFRRYPLQWGQAFMLLAAWVVYVLNIFNLPSYFDLESNLWRLLLFYANFCFTCFFAAAVAGRFIFPVVSLEGQTVWILKSAPLAMESVLWSKFWQSFIPLFLLSASMVAIGNVVLGVHIALFQVSLLCVLVVTLSLTSLSLGMGAIFADFTQQNPMKIANTPGGILCIFISLIFMVLMTTIFAWPTYLHYKSTLFQVVFPLTEWVTVVILFIALGIVVTVVPLKMGLRALNGDLKA
jgi:ABC-2 type transport system permease protein